MNGFSQTMAGAWRQIWLLLATALILAACGGNPEKSDLEAIGRAFQEAGYSAELNQDYQARMQAAKTEDELKVLVADMAELIGKTPAKLDALALKTEQGKSVRDKMSHGLSKVADAMKQSLHTDQRDIQAQLAVQQALNEGQQEMMAGFREFADLAKKHHIEVTLPGQ